MTGAAYAGTLGAALAIVVASGAVEIPLRDVYVSDLSYIWAGPRAALTGYDPYDAASWRAAVDAFGTQPYRSPAVYSYPPAILLALLPFGLVPLPALAVAWLALPLLLAALALRALLGQIAPRASLTSAAAAAALVVSEPAVVTMRNGQWTYLLLAALCAAVVLALRGRPIGAALASLALLVKAHLFGLALPAMVVALAARSRRRYVAVLASIATGLTVVSALARPSWWQAWWSAVPFARAAEANVTTAWRVLGELLGPVGAAGAALLFVGAVAALVAVREDRVATLSIGVAGSLAIAPYMRSYDHLLAIVPIVLGGRVIAASAPGWADALTGLALVVFTAASWALIHAVGEPRGSESLSWLVPLAVLVFAALAALVTPLVSGGPAPPRGSPPPDPRAPRSSG